MESTHLISPWPAAIIRNLRTTGALGVTNEYGSISRDAKAPDVPTFNQVYEAAHGKAPSDMANNAWRSLIAVSVPLSKSWNVLAGTPPEVVEVRREAAKTVYAEMMLDANGKKILGPHKNIMTDAAIEIHANGTTFNPESAEWLAKCAKNRFNITIVAKTK